MLRRVDLPEIPGALYLMRMPGRLAPFEDDLQAIQQAGVAAMISLAPLDEIRQCAPGYARRIEAGDLPLERREYPIEDYSVPGDRQAFLVLAGELAAELRSGKKLLVHCAGGVGRTGTLAACVLLALGLPEEQALERVQAAGSHPETDEQKRLVHWAGGF